VQTTRAKFRCASVLLRCGCSVNWYLHQAEQCSSPLLYSYLRRCRSGLPDTALISMPGYQESGCDFVANGNGGTATEESSAKGLVKRGFRKLAAAARAGENAYVPRNMPASGDLFDLFSFRAGKFYRLAAERLWFHFEWEGAKTERITEANDCAAAERRPVQRLPSPGSPSWDARLGDRRSIRRFAELRRWSGRWKL
jgi:hypothetical protein